MLARGSSSALTIVVVSVRKGHNHFGQISQKSMWVLSTWTVWTWPWVLIKVWNIKEECRTYAAGWFYASALGAHIAYQKGEMSQPFQELFGMQHSIAFQANAQQSQVWLVVVVHPLLYDLQLNYWTALGLLHHLRLARTKGKTAAVRPDSLMLTKCSAIIRQKQHIIAQYSWKAKLSAGCLPRGICEWLWWQRASGTEVFFML